MDTITRSKPQPLPASLTKKAKTAKPSKLLDSVCNSVTISLIEAPWWIAMLTLVFAGPLQAYLGLGSVYLIAGSVISMTIVAYFSSWKGAIWIPQDVPTAMLVLISGKMLAEMPGSVSMDSKFATVIVSFAIASMLTGLGMYLAGSLKLGKFVNLLPMPVVAGFLGGTGCLLLLGGIKSATGDLASGDLLATDAVIRWLPCVALALFIYVAGRRIKHSLLIPASMLAASLLLFAISGLMGLSVTELMAEGWLFNAAVVADDFSLLKPEQLHGIQWSVIFSQSHHLLILVIASVISMLLNNSGFELFVGRKLDHDKDLRTTGIANLLAGMVGGWPGYMSPAWSSLNTKQGRQLPLTGILVAVLSGLILWFAADFLAYIPRFVVGSAVAYVGVSFLFDWVVFPVKRLSWKAFSVVVIVMVGVVVLGV